MNVSINQPAYIPWGGYFHRIAMSDVHVVLDSVQFEKNSYINRNRIKTVHGPAWLTIPVLTKGRFGDAKISTLEIDRATRWREKHWKSILQNYGKCKYFSEYADFFEKFYATDWALLADACREMTAYLLRVFNISTKITFSSGINTTESKGLLVLQLCIATAAKTYISGPFGRDYLDLDLFRRNNISVFFHDYIANHYTQRYGGFQPRLSAIDLLFNLGPESGAFLLENQAPFTQNHSMEG